MSQSTQNVLIPALGHDDSTAHWADAQYSVGVALKQGVAAVVHQLKNAPGIEEMIAHGTAAYATELRCPRTLYSELIYKSDNASQTICWDDRVREDDLYLIPGIVAVSDYDMPTDDLDPFVRGDCTHIAVPAGWWLARGPEYRFTPLLASLIRFVKDKDGVLGQGMMSVEESETKGNPSFKITLEPSIYDRCRERDIQISALIAACGLLPRSTMAHGGENENCQLAIALATELAAKDVPHWDSEEFDPALAATALERIEPPQQTEQ